MRLSTAATWTVTLLLTTALSCSSGSRSSEILGTSGSGAPSGSEGQAGGATDAAGAPAKPDNRAPTERVPTMTVVRDAGTPVDSGAPVDSGTPVDSGAPIDSGSPVDSGAPVDSATPVDAGSLIDADGCPLTLVGFASVEGGTTGGGEAKPTDVTTQAELRTCATAAAPAVCRVRGTIKFEPFEEIRVASDKTIIGAGANAEIVMGGFMLGSGVHNVILRNLTIRDSFIEGQYEEGGDEGGDRDGVQMDTAHHVWIDHVHFRNLGDGMIDSRKDTSFLTVSWNILENHNKAFGIGWTDNVTAQMTIHHNWIHDTVQRNPSTDNVLRAHLYNNLLEDVESYGNYSRGATNMVLQNSTFVRVNSPHYYDTGTLVAIGNVYRDTKGMRSSTGTTFSAFDPSKFYAYELDSAADAEKLVKRCAGPRATLGN